MTPFAWKALCALLFALLVLQNLLSFRRSRSEPLLDTPDRSPTASPPQSASCPADPGRSWTYDHERDANNHALSRAQCDAAFPDLYYEIDRAVRLWQDKGHTITADDIEVSWRRDAALRVLVHEGQIRITETRHTHEFYKGRTSQTLHQLYRAVMGAIAVGEQLPTVEFSMVVDDMSLIPNAKDDTHTTWTFTRRKIDHDQDRTWMIPDFNFWSLPSPESSSWWAMQQRATDYDAFFLDKIPKVIWRGAVWTNQHVRSHLLQEAEGKAWSDVEEVDWKNRTNVMPMDDMCAYQFVVHTEGRSWSGRLKYLLNCDSLLVVHALDWTNHYYHLLVPDGPAQNYIPADREFSHLDEKVNYFMEHPVEAQRVIDNSIATFRNRYTTPAAEACYWRRLLHGWKEVAFDPEIYENFTDVVNGAEVQKTKLRGISFEEFVNLDSNYPPPPKKKEEGKKDG